MDKEGTFLDFYGEIKNTSEEWERMRLIYDAALREINTKLETLNNEFKMRHQYNPIEHMTSRIKSPESIAKKLKHNGRRLTVENIIRYINDVAGIRVICSYASDIYRIAHLISEQSDVTILKIKDYIKNPKQNGYKSYHMIVSVPVFLSDMTINTKVEIQIRTIAMDFWASLEHKLYYKKGKVVPRQVLIGLNQCADLAALLDEKMQDIRNKMKPYLSEEERAVQAARAKDEETVQNNVNKTI